MLIKIICGQLDSTDLEVVGGGFDDSMRRFEKQDAWPRPPRYFFEGTIFNGVPFSTVHTFRSVFQSTLF